MEFEIIGIVLLAALALVAGQCSCYFAFKDGEYNKIPFWAYGVRYNPLYIASRRVANGKAYKICDKLNFIGAGGFGGETIVSSCYQVMTSDAHKSIITDEQLKTCDKNIDVLIQYFEGNGGGGELHRIFKKIVPNNNKDNIKNGELSHSIVAVNHLFLDLSKEDFLSILQKIEDYGASQYFEYIDSTFRRLNPRYNSSFLHNDFYSFYDKEFKVNKKIYEIMIGLLLASNNFSDFKGIIVDYIDIFENYSNNFIVPNPLGHIHSEILMEKLITSKNIIFSYNYYLEKGSYIPLDWYIELYVDGTDDDLEDVEEYVVF